MLMFHGSSLAPKLFNFYLNIALQRSLILKKKIEDNSLLDYTDNDITITFKNKNELETIIQALENLEFQYNLKINKSKSKFIMSKKTLMNVSK